MWLLACRASTGYLSRMTQWKVSLYRRRYPVVVSSNHPEQSKLAVSSSATIADEDVKGSLKLGLFSYPVLQAADILVYRYDNPRAASTSTLSNSKRLKEQRMFLSEKTSVSTLSLPGSA